MKVVVAVEFEVPGWDGSKKAIKGGHRFRHYIKKEDRGARVAQALASMETIAELLGTEIAVAMFPGTTFTEQEEVSASGIAACRYPVLFEAPNGSGDDKDLNNERKDRAFLHLPKPGHAPTMRHWLQRVVGGSDARLKGTTFNEHELVTAFLDELGARVAPSSAGQLLPLICGEIGVVPQYRPNSIERHVCDWPKLGAQEATALTKLMSLWKDSQIVLNPFHTRMAWYSDLRREALSRRDKLLVAVGNIDEGSRSTTLRVFLNGKATWQQRREADIDRIDVTTGPRTRGDILGVWEGPAGERNRYWFIGAAPG